MNDEFDWEGGGLADWQGQTTASEFTFQKHEPEYVIQINGNDSKFMVGIKYDGTLVYGENYNPDEAAKIFWKALVHHMPGVEQAITKPNTTPWAVICREHGKQYLTSEQYDAQMMKPDSYWLCPICGGHSSWDDDNYDNYYNEEK